MIERKVLRALQKNARLSITQLAHAVGATEEQVEHVITQCEREGIIRGYKTVIDWERVTEERVVAFIDVSVSPQREHGFDQVAARIYRYPEVRSVHLVSGASDLRVVVEGPSIRHVAAFVGEKLSPIDHVTATNTHFLLKTYKEDGEIMVEDSPDDRRLAVMP